MSTISETITAIRRKLSIESANELVTDDTIRERISSALSTYDKHRPREARKDFKGAGTASIPVPEGWVDRFSIPIRLDFPGGDFEDIPIEPDEYDIVRVDKTEYSIATASLGATSLTLSTVANAVYFPQDVAVKIFDGGTEILATEYENNVLSANGNTTTGVLSLRTATVNNYNSTPKVRKTDFIRLYVDSPQTTEFSTLVYAVPHVLSDDTTADTIPTSDYWAVVDLAASGAASAIAAKFAKSQDPPVLSDAIDFGTKYDFWSGLATKLRNDYYAHLGIDPDDASPPGSSIHGDIDLRFQHGRSFLFHHSR